MRRKHLLERFEAFQRQTNRFLDLLAQEDGVAYRVPSFDPSDVKTVSTDWDGGEAEASYPNPSADDTDLDFLADHYLLVPGEDADRTVKSNYKMPIRMGPGGPVNTNAVEAAIAAINGARGGVEGVSEDALRRAYDNAVDILVAAGVYDEADDAPDFDPANVSASIVDDQDDPDDGQADASGADQDPTDDPPGGDDQAQAGDQDGADDVFDDVDLTAQVTARFSPDDGLTHREAIAQAGGVEASADGLVGIIWGAGNHDLGLGGEPTRVHVPPKTVEPTFQALNEDVQADQVEIGLDHAPDDSVLAQSGLREIAVADDVAMAADGKNIVLTDSSFTSDQALQAHEQGEFDHFDFSVVADVAIRTEEDGNRVTTEAGRLVLDAVRVTRIDVVEEGAVNAASVGRVPELAAGLETVQQAAQNLNQSNTQDAVQALQASATALDDLSKTMQNGDIDPDDVDDLDAAKEQLSAAADVIDDLQEDKDSLSAQASAFEDVASAHGVDVDDYDDVEAAAQAVVDEQTEDIRASIAQIESELPSFDIDDVEARQEDLTGRSKDDLQNLLNARKADKLDAVEAQQNKGRAASKKDQSSGRSSALQASGSGDADADELALAALGGRDRIEQQAGDKSPAAFVAEKYDVQASQYDAPDELADDINAAAAGGDN
jgi:hypothetical protein